MQVDIVDMGSVLRLGRSPGGGHGNSLQYSCLENPMDSGARQATVHTVAKSWTQLKQLSVQVLCRCSLAQSCLILRSNGLQHARLPCASPSPGVCPTHVRWVNDASNHLVLCHPLLLLPSLFPSNRVFSSESAFQIRLSKYWNFSFNISPSSEHPGLISYRMDWLDLLAVQGTLKRLLQHHSLKASILQLSVLFMVQHSHPYLTTGKTIASTRQTFVGKVICLLFNMLSRFVIVFLPKSEHLLISWL